MFTTVEEYTKPVHIDDIAAILNSGMNNNILAGGTAIFSRKRFSVKNVIEPFDERFEWLPKSAILIKDDWLGIDDWLTYEKDLT